MWFFLWFVLSAIILVISAWSFRILFQQKQAWRAFAQKMGLTYNKGRMLQSPTITGSIKNIKISFYTTFQRTNDVRGQRYVTVIELEMGAGMPTAAAIATEEYEGFAETLKMHETLTPDFKDWDSSYIVRTKSRDVLAAYLTPERVQVLHNLFSMNNAFSLLFFDELECILRIETTDPLRKAENMEKITKRMLSIAQKLMLTEEEKAGTFAQPLATQATVTVPDTAQVIELQLEEDEPSINPSTTDQAADDINKP